MSDYDGSQWSEPVSEEDADPDPRYGKDEGKDGTGPPEGFDEKAGWQKENGYYVDPSGKKHWPKLTGG